MKKAFFSGVAAFLCVLICICALSSCARTKRTQPKRGTVSEEQSTEITTTDVDTDHRICIDPGHGFADRGFLSPFIDDDEKTITLSFSSQLRDELISRGYDVCVTHDGTTLPLTPIDNGDDVFDAKERATAADHAVDYLISVHCSTYAGSDSQSVSGARVYYFADADNTGHAVSACEAICKRIAGAFPDATVPRVIKAHASDGDSVMQYVDMCAVTLNLAFMSCERDAKNLVDEKWKALMVKAVADAVDDYFS